MLELAPRRRALVTGSTRGIGHQIAVTLAECGADVAIVGRSQERANEVAATIPRARGFQCDVSEPAQVEQLVDGDLLLDRAEDHPRR